MRGVARESGVIHGIAVYSMVMVRTVHCESVAAPDTPLVAVKAVTWHPGLVLRAPHQDPRKTVMGPGSHGQADMMRCTSRDQVTRICFMLGSRQEYVTQICCRLGSNVFAASQRE